MTSEIVAIPALFAALGTGLVAGIFFAFSAFVMTALGRLRPDQGINAMQSINIAVLNPWFFAAFFGTAAACLVLAVIAVLNWSKAGATYLIVGSSLYLVGTILVTVAFNVPLNEALAKVEPDSAAGSAFWTRYLSAWTAWNHVRTVASLVAMGAFVMALR